MDIFIIAICNNVTLSDFFLPKVKGEKHVFQIFNDFCQKLFGKNCNHNKETCDYTL